MSKKFKATPVQIKALRKALNWTQRDLASFLNLYLAKNVRFCHTVSRWERGLHKPSKWHVAKMETLVHYYQTSYNSQLRQLEKVKDETIIDC